MNTLIFPFTTNNRHYFGICERFDNKPIYQWKGIPDIPVPTSAFQLLLGNPEAFPGQMRYEIPSVSF